MSSSRPTLGPSTGRVSLSHGAHLPTDQQDIPDKGLDADFNLNVISLGDFKSVKFNSGSSLPNMLALLVVTM